MKKMLLFPLMFLPSFCWQYVPLPAGNRLLPGHRVLKKVPERQVRTGSTLPVPQPLFREVTGATWYCLPHAAGIPDVWPMKSAGSWIATCWK